MKFDIKELDRQMEFCAKQAKRLRMAHGGQQWAVSQAQSFDDIHETLRRVRQDQQMAGPTGKRIDAPAVLAVPELEGKKAVVCYFKTEEDRAEFSEALKGWMPGTRTVNIP